MLTPDDLVILGVTFDSKMTFEKHLLSVSRAASQRLGILSKSWRVFHDNSLLGRCFRRFVLPVLKYCSAVWCSAADTRLKLLDRAVSRPRFLTGGVFECDIAHRRSVAVLWMLYKNRCNPVELSKLLKREGRAGAEGAILPYVGHLQLISTLKIGADCCQLCQYKLTKPNLT